MPTAAGEAREDGVINAVVAALRSSGRRVMILDRPDRNPNRRDGLTTDLEALVDGEKWALDVMVLRWRSGLEGAIEKVKSRLNKELSGEIRSDETLVLYCHVATDASVIDGLLHLASTAVRTASDQWRGDEAALLRPRIVGLGAIEICPWLSSTADIAEEVSSTSGLAVRKKLDGQIRCAHDLGHRAALAVDQHGAEDLTVGANFLPSPSTVVSVIEGIEQQVGVCLDGLVLVDANDVVQLLRW